ncbi:MAG: hypothetical protein R3B83_10575 [Nitrospirales bacterium]|nr:hypothetical protein [Nitrospirales bacterium]
MVLREMGRVFKEAFDLSERIQFPKRVPFQGGLDQGRDRFVPHHHASGVTGHLGKGVSHRRVRAPIAIHNPGLHPVFGLFSIFLALMLRNTGQHILYQQTVRVFAKFDRGRHQFGTNAADQGPQLEMRFQSSGQAGDIINHHDILITFLAFEKMQHLPHTGAVNHSARCAFITKYLHHFIAFGLSELTASGFLRPEPITLT